MKNVAATLKAIPPFAWLAIAGGAVALYLAKRASDAAGKGIDAAIDFLKPGPKIDDVVELKGETRLQVRPLKIYARNDVGQYSLRAEAGEFGARAAWMLYMDGRVDDRGDLDLDAFQSATFKTWPRQLEPMRRYELRISAPDGMDGEQVLAWGGAPNADF